MNYYPHHIGDFNNATRHLSRVERSLYRDMIDMYYDTEQPLTLDFKLLCRKLMARDEEESTAVEQVLNEFFTKGEQGWIHERCEQVISEYREQLEKKSAAGKASAEARAAAKAASEAAKTLGAPTGVEQPLNNRSTNQEPITNNHKPETKEKAESATASRLLASFESFWKAYPKKTAKGDALKAFNKIKPSAQLIDTILAAVEAQKGGKAWCDEDGKYIPNPATWLNGKRWEDEVVPYVPQAKQSNGAWWATDATIIAKGEELGMRPLPGEQMLQFKGRIQAAIDNGGKPPAPRKTPSVVVRESVEQIDADKGDKKKPGIPAEARQAMLSAAGSKIRVAEAT